MSGTFPASPAPAQAAVRSLAPTRVSVAHSMKRQKRSRGAQRWAIRLSWHNLSRATFAPIWAFSLAQRGQAETFQVVLPAHEPQGSWAGTPVVDGAGQTGFALNLRGLTVGATLKAGDYFKVAGHGKVYIVTADATADALGKLTAAIYPALMASPADGEAVTKSSVPFTVGMASDVRETTVVPGLLYDFELDLVEDV